MDILNEDNSQHKYKQKINKREITNHNNIKFNNFINNSKFESSFSNNLNLVSGYSSIANQNTEFGTIVGNQNNKQLETYKTLKDENKITIKLNNKLNPENLDYIFDKKIKAFENLEGLENLSDSELHKQKKIIPKLDFSEIFRDYKNTRVKIKIVKGLSSSSLSSKSKFSLSSSSKDNKKHKKNIKKKKTDNVNIQKEFSSKNYYSKNTENLKVMYSNIFGSFFDED